MAANLASPSIRCFFLLRGTLSRPAALFACWLMKSRQFTSDSADRHSQFPKPRRIITGSQASQVCGQYVKRRFGEKKMPRCGQWERVAGLRLCHRSGKVAIEDSSPQDVHELLRVNFTHGQPRKISHLALERVSWASHQQFSSYAFSNALESFGSSQEWLSSVWRACASPDSAKSSALKIIASSRPTHPPPLLLVQSTRFLPVLILRRSFRTFVGGACSSLFAPAQRNSHSANQRTRRRHRRQNPIHQFTARHARHRARRRRHSPVMFRAC